MLLFFSDSIDITLLNGKKGFGLIKAL